MNTEHSKISVRIRFIAAGTCIAFFAGCATTPQTASRLQYGPAASILREARSSQVPVEKRAADYLQVAAMTAPLLGTGAQETPACDTYNAACGELTVLLRSSEGGRLWNHPLTLTASNKTYHLRLQPASYAVWAPDYFASFKLADSAQRETREDAEPVGWSRRRTCRRAQSNSPRYFHAASGGITAPVTATLDFHGTDATLALRRPAKQPTAMVEGKVRSLAANYSAPLLYYKPAGNETIMGTDGGAHGQQVHEQDWSVFPAALRSGPDPAHFCPRPHFHALQTVVERH